MNATVPCTLPGALRSRGPSPTPLRARRLADAARGPHGPLYSSGERHGSDERLREQLEPLFVEHGVDVVFTGHEHFCERIKPQKGIHYIISGAAAKLRRGNIGKSDLTAKGYDQGYTFMIIEIMDDEMYFQTITDQGITVDSGVIRRRPGRRSGGHASTAHADGLRLGARTSEKRATLLDRRP